ncbi:MAG TPA: hypothetical protein PL074_02415 [Thermoflexales bacterium]|nr:hypothetical protein [Thermoflexales bacterium]
MGMIVIAFIAYAVVELATPMLFQQPLGVPNFLPGVVFAGIVGFLMRYWDGWLGDIRKPFQKQAASLEARDSAASIAFSGCLTFFTGVFVIASLVVLGGYYLLTNPPPFLQEVITRLTSAPLISDK